VLDRELACGNFFRKKVREFLAEMSVKFHRVHNSPAIEQGTGEYPVTRPNLKHSFTFHFSKVRYTVYRKRIGKEMLIMMCFHRVVNT
jgi:hypothetical protein